MKKMEKMGKIEWEEVQLGWVEKTNNCACFGCVS